MPHKNRKRFSQYVTFNVILLIFDTVNVTGFYERGQAHFNIYLLHAALALAVLYVMKVYDCICSLVPSRGKDPRLKSTPNS